MQIDLLGQLLIGTIAGIHLAQNAGKQKEIWQIRLIHSGSVKVKIDISNAIRKNRLQQNRSPFHLALLLRNTGYLLFYVL